MSATPTAPLGTAVFLIVAMSIAGAFHVAWLKSPVSARFDRPVDGGAAFRGRRLFGDNKRLRGFVAMPVGAAFAFAALGHMRERLPAWIGEGMWPIQAGEYAVLGAVCGIAFMLAELPNSFVKRQLDIPPGQVPSQPVLKALFLVVDRCDSVLGVLFGASLLVPMQATTWAWVLLFGPGVHALFSALLHRLRIKARAL